MGFDIETRIRNVTAVLGPTNTGKTHLAIERMLGHESGMIGLPLRLLAREVYDRIVARIGADQVALVTGEEKIRPENARYWVSTVEAMPREVDVDFLAIDEIQLAADPERGHVFTDRLLHSRGRLETFLLGAQTMRDCISDLVPGANFISRPRLSKLTYSGQKKITRLPPRAAIVAFSTGDVYQIAELIRRQQGGAAVVMGALSPRTRNAQVALYQSGDVDYLVATDAIGMGLNLDVDHVAFASTRKFDGYNFRQLTPAELAQIAGRAGRHMNDGTFGVTGDVEPFEQEVVERLESHSFEPIKMLQWRARALDFTSVYALRESLRAMPSEQRLVRARMADDVEALENVCSDKELTELIRGPAHVALLWDVCQIPDYRKISSQNHAELVSTVFRSLREGDEKISEDWFAKQVSLCDRTDGDIDTLATRIAHIRTWTFVSNRPSWLKDPAHWQNRTREIEDALSDALHEQLTQRFVDRRTSALMKGMRAKEELNADVGDDGAIHVESHFVGRLKGFRFIPDNSQPDGIHGKATRSAAAQVLVKELGMRVRRVSSAKNEAFKLTRNGRIVWRDQEIARLEATEDGLKPRIEIISDEHLPTTDRDKVQERLVTWLGDMVAEKLQPLAEISKAEDITGLARGIAFRLVENFGSLKRDEAADELKSLDQPARAQLRKYGVRFGAFNVFFPQLMKPGPADLAMTLWLLKHGAASGLDLEALPEPPRPGLTSVPATPGIPEAFYRSRGYNLSGPRAVRMDILERLADMIRPMIAWRQKDSPTASPPRGATGDGGFLVLPEMLSILGCSGDELSNVLKALGFWSEKRPKKKKAAPAPFKAPEVVSESAAAEAAVSEGSSEVAVASPSEDTVAAEPIATDASPAAEAAAVEALIDEATAATAEAPLPNEAADASATTGAETSADPATTEAAIGDAFNSDAAAGDAATVEMEDVWRPRRHRRDERQGAGQRQERRPGQGREQRRGGERNRRPGGDRHAPAPTGVTATAGQPGSPEGVTAATTDPAAVGAQPGQRQGRDRRNDRNGDRQGRGDRDRKGPGQGQGQGQSQGQSQSGPGAPGAAPVAPGVPAKDGPRRDASPQGDRAKWAGQKFGGKDGRRDNRDRDRDRDRGGGAKPRNYTAGPTGASQRQTADPDSPFAKLIALKAALEKQGSSS